MIRLISYAILTASALAAAQGTDSGAATPPPIVTFSLTDLDLFDRGAQSVVSVPITAAEGVTVDHKLEVDVLTVVVGGTYAPELAHDITGAAGADAKSIALTVTLDR